MPEDAKYTNFTPWAQADYADGNVLGSLHVVLPVLLRAAAALLAAPSRNTLPARNARRRTHSRAQVATNHAAIAELACVRHEIVWDSDHTTGTDARLAHVYAGLWKIGDSLHLTMQGCVGSRPCRQDRS
jgi:hypothetical protein